MSKLSRRAFFRGAGAVIVAAPVAALAKLPAPPVKKMTIRMGLPKPTWRLWARTTTVSGPAKQVEKIVDLLNEHNEILDDLPWREKV